MSASRAALTLAGLVLLAALWFSIVQTIADRPRPVQPPAGVEGPVGR